VLRDLPGTAKIERLPIPQDCAEAGYPPSAALAEFVRFRDLTCRFPGCEKPAEACNIGHAMPFPVGPSHPSNLKLLCCYHHQVRTTNHFLRPVDGENQPRHRSDSTNTTRLLTALSGRNAALQKCALHCSQENVAWLTGTVCTYWQSLAQLVRSCYPLAPLTQSVA
jgi:hypothetical protein